MSQTAYNDAMAAGAEGDLAGSPEDRQIQTYINATEDIPFGRACAKISGDDDGVDLPSTSGDLIVGVAVRKQDSLAGQYEFDGSIGEPVCVLRKGSIYVKVEEAVTPDDDVFVRFAAEVHTITLTVDKDFAATDVVTGTVNDVAMATATWATTHDALLALVAAKLALLTTLVASATVTGAREITVVGAVDALPLVVDLTAAGGAAPTFVQATVTGPSDGDELGVFRTDDGDTGDGAKAVAVTASFLTAAAAGGVAVLDINLP